MKARILLIIFLLATMWPYTAVADDPVVTIKPPRSYYLKKALMFPLEIPSYAVMVGTLPIGALLKIMEEKGVVDKTLNFLSNKDKTFWVYPIIEGGAGSGFGGGIGIKHSDLFHRNYLLGASYKIHINMTQNANLSFGKANALELFGRPVSYSFGSSFRQTLGDDFFGMGNSTNNANDGQYSANSIIIGSTLAYQPVDTFLISPYFGFDLGDSWSKGNNGSSQPSVQDLFPAAELAGFDKWVNYAVLGIRLARDSRDNINETESGAVYSATFQRFFGMNRDGFNYNRYELDARKYFHLVMPRQVLLIRGNIAIESPDNGNDVPFWRLTTLDYNSPLRGFVGGRFHDRSSILFNIEYRFPVWRMIDGVIFYDTGRVFRNIEDMTLAHIKYSAGGGLNFRIPNLAFFKFQAAYGGEGVNIMFGAGKPL